MASQKQKASGGCAGAFMSTAVGVYLGNNSHPHWALVLYIAAAIAGIYTIIQWEPVLRLLGLERIERPASENALNISSGRDTNGSQFNHSPIFGDSAVQAFFTASKPAQALPEETAAPELILEHCEFIRVSWIPQRAAWERDARGSSNFLFAKIYYSHSEATTSPALSSVVAKLRFRTRSGATRDINSAYWLSKGANNIRLALGDHGFILLGRVEKDQFVSFENKHKTGFILPRRGGNPRPKGVPETIGDADGLMIEVVLVESSVKRMAHGRYLITSNGEKEYKAEIYDEQQIY